MRLSESLRKRAVEGRVGEILNRFKIRAVRRDVMFFEDIIALYIKECEDAGYGEEMMKCSRKWTILYLNYFLPYVFQKIPPNLFINSVLRKIWINIGLVDDILVRKKGNLIVIETKNEGTTRIIGKNMFIAGLYMGTLNALYNSEVKLLKSNQTKQSCVYIFKLESKPLGAEAKHKSRYKKLNEMRETRGYRLTDALKKKIFTMEKNHIYFRKKHITTAENTLSHLIGNKNILLDRIPGISYRYFKDIINEKTKAEEKLNLFKNLLQIMGWGIIKIIRKRNNVLIEIRNPPYGLQIEKDNWNFLTQTILGYLWLINEKFRTISINESYKYLKIKYGF